MANPRNSLSKTDVYEKAAVPQKPTEKLPDGYGQKPPPEAEKIDANAFNYGGSPTGAAEAATRYGDRANAYNTNSQQAYNYGNQGMQAGFQSLQGAQQGMLAGFSSLGNATATRGRQMQAADLMMARAQGRVPSIAEQVAARQSQQAAAQQMGLAAGARGPAAMALAQQNAAGNIANAQTNIAGQASLAAAQERLAAEQAAFGAYGGVRGQDVSQAQAGFQGASTAQQGAATAFQGAGVGYGASAQQGQLGLGYNQLGNQVQTTQLGANMQREAMNNANRNAAIDRELGLKRAEQERSDSIGMGLLNAGISLAPLLFASDASAKIPVTWGVSAPAPDPWVSTNGQRPDDWMLDARAAQTAEDAGKPTMGPSATPPAWLVKDMQARGAGNPYERHDGLLTAAQAEKAAKDEPSDGKKEKDSSGLLRGIGMVGGGALALGGLAKLLSDVNSKNPSPLMMSDEHAKTPQQEAAYLRGQRDAAQSVMPMVEPEGTRLGIDASGRGYLAAQAPQQSQGASLSAPAPRYAVPSAPAAAAHKAEPEKKKEKPVRKMTPDELMAYANAWGAQMDKEHAASLARPIAVAPALERMRKEDAALADANRSMAGQPYVYKPEFAASQGQTPGELNVGPMAQRMAADPVAGTAVKRDPETGLLALDRDKLVKVQSAGIASLQQQVDQLRGALAARGGR